MGKIKIFGLFVFNCIYGLVSSECPLSDPDCHPLCIEYVGECKYCRCSAGRDGSTETKNKWSEGYQENVNNWDGGGSGKGATGGGNGGSNTRVIIVHEKETVPQAGGQGMGGFMPFSMPHAPMAPQNPFSSMNPMQTSHHSKSLNVPLKSPGIPKYCVSINKMEFESCSCTVVDEDGCLTCPCYSASRFWIAVKQKHKSEEKPPAKKNGCVGTMLCMMSCKGGYKLGETGPDGCQSCTCMKQKEKPTAAPARSERACLKLYECIIKCSENKQGFTVGEETKEGCRSCRCLEENNTGGSGGTNKMNGGNEGGTMMQMFGNKGANYLKSPDKGVGTQNESKTKCNPPLVMCTNDGNNIMQTMAGGSGGGGGTSGGSGSGSGSGMESPFNPTSGGAGSGSGMKSPFTGGGPGAGMGGPGMGMSGGPGMGSGGGGAGPGMGGMGPHGPPNPGFPSQKKVKETAYNENCFGPSCSAKDGGLIEGSLGNDLMSGDFRK